MDRAARGSLYMASVSIMGTVISGGVTLINDAPKVECITLGFVVSSAVFTIVLNGLMIADRLVGMCSRARATERTNLNCA
jgi:hypothetical protein